MKNPIYVILGVLVLAVGGYFIWWLAAPLFFDQTVDEAFPTTVEELAAADPAVLEAMPDAQKAELQAAMNATAEAMPDKMIEEEMPMEAAEPIALSMGNFMGLDDFHQGEGVATIYQLPDGQHVLRFESFNVTNGPDLHVLLSTSADPFADLGDYVDLGMLKGNMGNQNYPIPADVDVSQYQSVVIYCLPFHVNFASATLQ